MALNYGYVYDGPGTKCLGGAQPGAHALMDHVLKRFGCRNDGIYNCRPVRGGSTLSFHAEGRACDFGCDKAIGDRIAAWLVVNAPIIGIQEVIWNRMRWDSQHRDWRAYGGQDPHTGHVHTSLCWAAARTLTTHDLDTLDHQEDDDMTPDQFSQMMDALRNIAKATALSDNRLSNVEKALTDISADGARKALRTKEATQ